MPFTTTRHQPHKAPRKLEAKAFASVCLAPWTEGFAKAGSVFWPPFWARQREFLYCGVGFGGHLADPSICFRRFFFHFFSPHCCLGPGFGPGRAWSREPSCWDLARAIPRLLPRSACRRKPAAWLPRCSARALNPQALKPGSPSALKPFRLEGDLKPYAPDALEPFSPQTFKDSCPCAVTFLSPQALQLQA